MPEEINHLLTDQVADLLFTPSPDGNDNLVREGIAPEKIHWVGNVMIDTVVRLLSQTATPQIDGIADRYVLVTLHRPPNVDDAAMLRQIVQPLDAVSLELQVIFPVHLHTRQRLLDCALSLTDESRFMFLDPLGYLEFLALQRQATAIVTDSGGIQEESTFLGVPCLTIWENTERSITVDVGTNGLVGRDMQRLRAEVERILAGTFKVCGIPPLWDGKASERLADVVEVWEKRQGPDRPQG